MKIATLICRILLGLGFIAFGLNGFLHFMGTGPVPPPDSLPGKWMAAMIGSGWFSAVALMQILGGALVLAGVTAPLGLAILAPILFNILCFHIFLAHGAQIGGGVVFTLLELFLIYAYRPYFAGLLTTKATPAV